MRFAFHKMHGLGNDFVVIDARAQAVDIDAGRARAIADRHTGIGCDQLILLEPSERADLRMRIFNADGGEVEQCGNALRCVAQLTDARRIETAGGLVEASSTDAGSMIDMGAPRFDWEDIPVAYALDTADLPVAWGPLQHGAAVNVGNPHIVFFADDIDAFDLATIGPEIEHDALFPARINVNVAQITGPASLRLRVWERGAGLTRACGTGACATAVAGIRRGLVRSPVTVSLPGGELVIAWAPGGTIRMTGPATHVFTGEADLDFVRVSQVITLGCRLNIAESETIRAMLPDDDLIVVNSCAVTEEAVRQTRRAIRRAHRERPVARIVVTGCAAEVERASFVAMPEVSGVVSNLSKLEVEAYSNTGLAELVEALPFLLSESGRRTGLRQAQANRNLGAEPNKPTHARAFVEVQNGCDHRCTFCIIPFGRGPSRSSPAGAVIDRIEALVDQGAQEVVLTGVDVTSYGDLTGDSLGLLVERILTAVPALPRLRLSSLDPVEIDDRLFALIAGEPRLMPHLHLSLQAGADMILKRMKRRHLRADAIRLVERVKAARPEVAIGADLIAGFPTETEKMFADSIAIVEQCDIVFGHIFPYSPRAGTPAARMPQLEREVIRARARTLREACAARRGAWLDALIGSRQRVLIELDGRAGHAENFAKVESVDGLLPRSIHPLRIAARRGDTLIGSLA